MKLSEIISKQTVINIDELAKDTELCKEVQELLHKHGFLDDANANGLFGPKTKSAFARFKQHKNQADLDILGPGSAHLLLSLPNYPKTLAGKVARVCDQKQYFLDRREGAVNIIGLEGISPDGSPNSDTPDAWNDSIGLLTFKSGVPEFLCLYRGTTEPGSTYTWRPLNIGGAARLDLGQHKDLWMVGQHRGYEAMQQVGIARIWRDKNKNHSRDDVITKETGNGINLHSTRPGLFMQAVQAFSAGCCVIRVWTDFQNFMRLVKNSSQYRQNKSAKFTFTLLWRDWLTN